MGNEFDVPFASEWIDIFRRRISVRRSGASRAEPELQGSGSHPGDGTDSPLYPQVAAAAVVVVKGALYTMQVKRFSARNADF